MSEHPHEEPISETPISSETLVGIRMVNRTVSHFLRNSLNPISGGAEMLLENPTLSDSQRELVEGIATAAQQLKDRMDRLQIAARTGEFKLINGPVGSYIDLNEPEPEK